MIQSLRVVYSAIRMAMLHWAADPQWVIPNIIAPFIFTTVALTIFRDAASEFGLYAVLGGGMMGMWGNTLYSSGHAIEFEKWQGTLEEVMATPSNLIHVITGRSISNALFGLINMFAVLLIATLGFRIPLGITDPLLFTISLVLNLPEYWFKHFQLSRDPIDVFREHRHLIKIYPEVPSVLELLSKKYDLIVASGLPKNLLEIAIEDVKTYFTHVFSPVTDLGEVSKSVGFYEMICKTLNIDPQSIVHIGDNWDYDFAIPQSLGMVSFFLDRTGKKKGKYVIENLKEIVNYLKLL